jgi:peroxiredoxin family protein
MKKILKLTALLIILSGVKSIGQEIQIYHESNQFSRIRSLTLSKKHEEVKGSPYLDSVFTTSEVHFKDRTSFKIPLRFNIYNNAMEYKSDNKIYDISNPEVIDKIFIGDKVYVYIPYIEKGGYFNLLESGKCFLVVKHALLLKPAEAAAAYKEAKPAEFVRKVDRSFFVVNNQTYEIKSKKSVIEALDDKRMSIETFIKQQKIKNIRPESLSKIVKYYNSLF